MKENGQTLELRKIEGQRTGATRGFQIAKFLSFQSQGVIVQEHAQRKAGHLRVESELLADLSRLLGIVLESYAAVVGTPVSVARGNCRLDDLLGKLWWRATEAVSLCVTVSKMFLQSKTLTLTDSPIPVLFYFKLGFDRDCRLILQLRRGCAFA